MNIKHHCSPGINLKGLHLKKTSDKNVLIARTIIWPLKEHNRYKEFVPGVVKQGDMLEITIWESSPFT